MKMKIFILMFALLKISLQEIDMNDDIEESQDQEPVKGSFKNISYEKALPITEDKESGYETEYPYETAQKDQKEKFLDQIYEIIKSSLNGFDKIEEWKFSEDKKQQLITLKQNEVYIEYHVEERDIDGNVIESSNWNYLVFCLTDNQDKDKRLIEYEIEVQYIDKLLQITMDHLKRNLKRFTTQYQNTMIDLSKIKTNVGEILKKYNKPNDNSIQGQIYFMNPYIEDLQDKIIFTIQVDPLQYGELQITLEKIVSQATNQKQLKITYESNFFEFENNFAILNDKFLEESIKQSLDDIKTQVFENLENLSKDSTKRLDENEIKLMINIDPTLFRNSQSLGGTQATYKFEVQEQNENLMIKFDYDTENVSNYLIKNQGKITITNYFPMSSLYDPSIFPLRFIVYIQNILRKIQQNSTPQEDLYIDQSSIDNNPFQFSDSQSEKNTQQNPNKIFNISTYIKQLEPSFTSDQILTTLEKVYGKTDNIVLEDKKLKKKLLLL